MKFSTKQLDGFMQAHPLGSDVRALAYELLKAQQTIGMLKHQIVGLEALIEMLEVETNYQGGGKV